MMNSLYLVSCVAAKRPRSAKAEELYTSPWFQKAARYVQERRGSWRILSAKYGLLDPETVVDPYEQTLNRMSVADRKNWAARVLTDLEPLVGTGDTAIFLAGDRYREFLVPPLLQRGVIVEIPMEGLQIGRQLQWLDAHLHG